jgi:hypothetical protein
MNKRPKNELFWIVVVPLVAIVAMTYEIISRLSEDSGGLVEALVGALLGCAFMILAFQRARETSSERKPNSPKSVILIIGLIALVPFISSLSPAWQLGVYSFLDAGALAFVVIVGKRLVQRRQEVHRQL